MSNSTKTAKKKSLTKLESSKEAKKEFYETAEEILATGDENANKAAKAVIEVEKKKVKEEYDHVSDRIQKATDKRRFDDFGYLTQIREAAVDMIQTFSPSDWPGWAIKLYVTTGKAIAIG